MLVYSNRIRKNSCRPIKKAKKVYYVKNLDKCLLFCYRTLSSTLPHVTAKPPIVAYIQMLPRYRCYRTFFFKWAKKIQKCGNCGNKMANLLMADIKTRSNTDLFTLKNVTAK